MPAINNDAGSAEWLVTPASNVQEVTPDDVTDLDYVTRGLWIGVAGSVYITAANGAEALIQGIPAGTILPIRVSRVHATGTTATGIVALW